MAKDGKYAVTLTIMLDVEFALVIDAEDKDFAHDKAMELSEDITKAINQTLDTSKIKQRVTEVDDILDVTQTDTMIDDEIEELEAPVTDEEEAK